MINDLKADAQQKQTEKQQEELEYEKSMQQLMGAQKEFIEKMEKLVIEKQEQAKVINDLKGSVSQEQQEFA